MYLAPVLVLSAKGYSGIWGLRYYDDNCANNWGNQASSQCWKTLQKGPLFDW